MGKIRFLPRKKESRQRKEYIIFLFISWWLLYNIYTRAREAENWDVVFGTRCCDIFVMLILIYFFCSCCLYIIRCIRK